MNQQRLKDLQDNLDLLDEKLGMFEQELIICANANQKFEVKQRIKKEIIPQIERYETEFWGIITTQDPGVVFENADEHTVTEVLTSIQSAVTAIKRVNSSNSSNELMEILRDIQAKLNQPEASASAKLKGTIPLVPGLLSYEVELDTEKFISNRVLQGARKLLKKPF
ncbi:hypothetical protein NG799_03330 [Laspinema sp. D1]|uniref:ATP synthase F(1) sector subunit delta n=1 Tax=Laspinema palackyanum D2a TaxID=2953684 RepID=A0ABT2MKT7_9CYAN|nr:hypothetical protein [Laspinema sp. D2a]